MSDIRFRPLRPEDTWTAYAIFRRSLADLLTRQGQSWPWVEQDEAEWLKWRSLFEHLEATADQAWGAELDGELVGYARSIRRSGSTELTEFFTLPEAQGKGVGRGLLARAFPAQDTGHRSILATSDPAALAQYLRHGLLASCAMYAFEGRVGGAPDPLPADLVATPLAELPTDERLAMLGGIDEEVLGTRRDVDHAWLGTRGQGWLLQRAGTPVGYAYGGERQGPIATLHPADMPLAIGIVEREAATRAEGLSLTVPLANHAATKYLLSRRYRIDPFTMHLLEDRPVVAADRYILTSPPFFL